MMSPKSNAIYGLEYIELGFLNHASPTYCMGVYLVIASHALSSIDVHELKIILDLNQISFFNDEKFTSKLFKQAVKYIGAYKYDDDNEHMNEVSEFIEKMRSACK